MDMINELKNLAEQTLAQKNIWIYCGKELIQVYENRLTGGGVQFNVTLDTHHLPTIKFEERSRGKFTVAVAPEDGASICYTQAKVFTVDEPIEHLAAAFPQSEDMKQFVNSLTHADCGKPRSADRGAVCWPKAEQDCPAPAAVGGGRRLLD